MNNPPIPCAEENIMNKFWKNEEWDEYIPSPGFISDFIYSLRGVEACTKYQIWAALYTLSCVVKRDAYIKWGPLDQLFLNLFVFLVGPPSTKKGTAINRAQKLVERMPQHLPKGFIRQLKTVNMFHSKATPEALFKFLSPRKINIGTEFKTLKSNGSIFTPELATFLGKQQYNTGLIELLTNFYDCLSHDASLTVSRPKDVLEDIYLTMIGGTTQKGLSDSIPEQAFGDGFLSRVNVIFQENRTRKYPYPQSVEGAPSLDELAERLAWITMNARGAYTPSEEADAAYRKWYDHFWEEENSNPDLNKRSMSRFDIHLLKLSTLIRIQRYEPGNIIELQDFQEAERILNASIQNIEGATADVGTTQEERKIKTVMDYIKKKGCVMRRKILTTHSGRKINADIVSSAVRELIQRGEITIIKNNKEQKFPSADGDEQYKWIAQEGD